MSRERSREYLLDNKSRERSQELVREYLQLKEKTLKNKPMADCVKPVSAKPTETVSKSPYSPSSEFKVEQELRTLRVGRDKSRDRIQQDSVDRSRQSMLSMSSNLHLLSPSAQSSVYHKPYLPDTRLSHTLHDITFSPKTQSTLSKDLRLLHEPKLFKECQKTSEPLNT